MVVVAIVGLLAAIAIPDYISFTTKAKQSEAKMNLKAIYTAEIAYFTETGNYTMVFSEIPWSPMGNVFYIYDIGGSERVGHTPVWAPDPAADAPGVHAEGFTILAYGNLDADDTVDTWQINDQIDLINRMNDAIR